MPTFYSNHSDLILCVLSCVLLLAGVVSAGLSRRDIGVTPSLVRWLGAGLTVLAAREWLGIIGVSEPGFVSWYPLAALMQTVSSLCLLQAARSVAPPGSARRTGLTAGLVLLILVFAWALVQPYLSYSSLVESGQALITARIFFVIKFTTFLAAVLLLACAVRETPRPPRSFVAALAVFCLHAGIIFVCRPPGPAGADADTAAMATHVNVWLFNLRILTALFMVVVFWNLFSATDGVRQLRWWPLALMLFILAAAAIFTHIFTMNFESMVRHTYDAQVSLLDRYLYRRPILLFIPLAFFGLLLLMSGQQNAWRASHSWTRFEAMRQARDYLQLVLDTIPVAVFVKDTNHRYRMMNKRFATEILQISGPEAAVGKRLHDVAPDYPRDAETQDDVAQNLRGELLTYDRTLERPGGTRHYEVTKIVRRLASGETILICCLHDITERHAAAEALRTANYAAHKADRAKAAFLANMSHELRTPMNGIVGMADLIIEHETTEPVPRLYAETVIKSAKTLQMVMDEVMDVATVDDASRRMIMSTAPFPLLSLVEEAAQIVGCIVDAWGVQLSLDYSFSLASIYEGDARHLRQVTVQILTHCSRLASDKRIRLEVAEDTGGVAFRAVFTPNPAIGPADLEMMFKQWNDAGSASDSHINLGMFNDRIGLPLVWRLVDAMGGALAVRERDGGLLGCDIVLPLQPSGPTGAAPLTPPSLEDVRVLVATRDDDMYRGVRDCLVYAKAETARADSKESAMQELRRSCDAGCGYDILFIDATLPGFTAGAELQKVVNSLAVTTQFGRPDVMLVVSPKQVGELVGFSGGISCLMLPPLCPSEIWYKVDAISAARRSEALSSGQPAETERRKPTTVKLRRRSTRITRLVKIPASVLLVEDNNVNQMVAMGILQRLGCNTVLAKNGREAVDLVTSGKHYDIIIMDCLMPVMDGYEATGLIRRFEESEPNGKRRIIVALTANTVAGDRERCLKAGMDDYISKPVTLEQLRDVISQHLPGLVTVVDQAREE
ncbi:MAG: response regulator [Planctomycetaceae bacterium]|nr:response regulator [Planctomycetaceae bacterium]